jgi:hypothetical protein
VITDKVVQQVKPYNFSSYSCVLFLLKTRLSVLPISAQNWQCSVRTPERISRQEVAEIEKFQRHSTPRRQGTVTSWFKKKIKKSSSSLTTLLQIGPRYFHRKLVVPDLTISNQIL